jgi:hypothetical protein
MALILKNKNKLDVQEPCVLLGQVGPHWASRKTCTRDQRADELMKQI